MSPEIVFTLLYFLISACIVYPPTECLSAGLTIESLFSNFLGSEHETFITYHIKKSCLNLFIYSLLPLGYILSLFFLGYTEEVASLFTSYTLFWKIFSTTGVIIPILSIYQIWNWCINNYEKHPIAINLTKFCNNNNVNWKTVASDIDIEFRRVEKICIQTSAIIKVVATENWILKVTPLTILAAHQSDASLVVKEADTYRISYHNANETQYLNIEVKSSRRRVDPFIIRINATDFKDLKDRVARSIEILPDVKFHKSVLEQFVDVFKETIANNPLYDTNEIRQNICTYKRINTDDNDGRDTSNDNNNREFEDDMENETSSYFVTEFFPFRIPRITRMPGRAVERKFLCRYYTSTGCGSNTDRFYILHNSSVLFYEELDQCIGCLQSRPTIKIQKLCDDTGSNNCSSCYCRPMWCTDCMAKWFAARQETEQQSRWLSSKCTCPMCRVTFCMLDVCMLREQQAEE